MARDAQGNNLDDAMVVVTSKILLVPYEDANKITPEMIAPGKAEPDLPDAFNPQTAAVGLITSDGAPQDGRDAEDATEFHQPGYLLNGDPTLTLAFTAAEDNDLIREVTQGDPDDIGVYHVSDIVQDTKWIAYQETVFRNKHVRRRAGVVQVTGNEPAQDSRGSVSGRALTATWQKDAMIDSNANYLEAIYIPKTVTSLTINAGSSPSVQVGKTLALTVTATYADKSTGDVTSSATFTCKNLDIATMEGANVKGVKAGSAVINATFQGITSPDVTVTVTSAS